MNSWLILYIFLCLSALAFSYYSYFKAGVSARTRVVLISLRTILIALLITALVEPKIQFERLSKPSKTIPVLIDNSKSMQLFRPESSVIPFLHELHTVNTKQLSRNSLFSFWNFGDSLRETTDQAYQFNDSESNLPLEHIDHLLKDAPSLVLLSDGNFTNSGILSEFNFNKEVYYLQLPSPNTIQSISLSVNAPQHTLTDSVIAIECLVTGFTQNSTQLIFSCFDQNKILSEHMSTIDSGIINNSIILKIKPQLPGKHILRITAVHSDTIKTEVRHLINITLDKLTYTTHAAIPSMDNRFIKLALKDNVHFTETTSKNSTADLIVVTRLSADINKTLSLLKPNGLILFAGCTPCSASYQYRSNSLIINMSKYSPVNAIDTTSFPPITILESCSPTSHTNTFAWATVKKSTHTDTLPVLFLSKYADIDALILSARDFWKWDFHPLISAQGEEQPFSFSHKVIETARKLVIQNSTDNYTAFIENNASETDSIVVNHFPPGSIPPDSLISIHFTLTAHNGNIFDTLFSSTAKEATNKSYLVPSSGAGTHFYSSSISYNNKNFYYADSFYIGQHTDEFSIKNQNKLILDKIGYPIQKSDSIALKTLLNKNSSYLRTPVKETIHLTRNWPMLVLIFAVYCTELILRRKYSLE